jgi:hypothetical protein
VVEKRFFSVDSPKAIKAEKFRYLNAINYMAHTRVRALAICAATFNWMYQSLSWPRIRSGFDGERKHQLDQQRSRFP